jgi:hypothetical protein
MRFTYAPGSRPLEGYTIKEGIGRGGFGEVYHAHSDGGKEVALKLVQRNLDVELRGVGQCLNLKHPNLLIVYDVKQAENGDNWIVMEFMAGDSLDKVIAAHPKGMPPDEAVRWLKGICDGVGYLHDRGIVHRDLKPGNLFVEHGHVKIGDYGLSKFITASRRSGQTGSVGTVHYMAPEVMKGRYGKEVDLYAIGIMLYEMLTGRVPFDGESPGEVLMKHLTAEPDTSALTSPFREVVARLLAKDPERRYPSVQAMLEDVTGAVGVLPVTGPYPEPHPPTPLSASERGARGERFERDSGVIARGPAWWFRREGEGWLGSLFEGDGPWQLTGLLLIRMVIAAALGVGSGLILYGLASALWEVPMPRGGALKFGTPEHDQYTREMRRYLRFDSASTMVGVGGGLFTGALVAYLLCFSQSRGRERIFGERSFSLFVYRALSGLLRLAVAVCMGVGGIVFVFGLGGAFFDMSGGRAAFMIVGLGIMLCAGIVYWLFFGWPFEWRPFQGVANAPASGVAHQSRQQAQG